MKGIVDLLIHKRTVSKLNNKVKRIEHIKKSKVGVKTMSQVARRLEILDKVLALFGMRIGAYQTVDLDIQGDVIVSIRLTVYFIR